MPSVWHIPAVTINKFFVLKKSEFLWDPIASYTISWPKWNGFQTSGPSLFSYFANSCSKKCLKNYYVSTDPDERLYSLCMKNGRFAGIIDFVSVYLHNARISLHWLYIFCLYITPKMNTEYTLLPIYRFNLATPVWFFARIERGIKWSFSLWFIKNSFVRSYFGFVLSN